MRARAKRRGVERFLDLIKVDFFTLLHTNDDTFSHARSPASTRREALTHDGRRGREFRTKQGYRNGLGTSFATRREPRVEGKTVVVSVCRKKYVSGKRLV